MRVLCGGPDFDWFGAGDLAGVAGGECPGDGDAVLGGTAVALAAVGNVRFSQ